jgi:hypothetical protein
MIVHAIKDLSNKYIVDFLKTGLEEAVNLENYHPDFSDSPANLFYILKEGRFKNSNYFIIDDNGKYAGSAGWNEYENVALVLTRAFIPRQYRGQSHMSKYLLPPIFKETEKYDKLWITCNDYNRNIYTGLLRLSQGKSLPHWQDDYKKFVPIGKRTVYYTEQYVAEYKRQ